ncbi:MAG: coproporphyrinogen dehydrogenase HemZ [Ruminococcaceae bacterium]|nr:coproporphyrinogen dehydrogenase HemZ [Oscillospiraceae bacterium]
MNLYTVNHKFHYELENLTRAFFPNEKISVEMLDEIPQELSPPYILTVSGEELFVSVSIGEFCKELTCVKGSDNELLMATLLYRLLEEYTGISLSWGLLTGVRPIKLFRKLKEQMGKEGAEDYFKNNLLVSEEKINLAEITCSNEQKILDLSKKDSFSLYISIPFCPTRCSYCSFVSQSVEKAKHLIPRYVELLCREITHTAKIAKECNLRLESVYMGGGTPTSLEADDLAKILKTVRDSFDMSTCREFTVEAGRPDTITEAKLIALKENGCDRLSVNPQTLIDEVLVNIGRRHTVEDFYKSFELARKVGFAHINTDLIAGLPGDTPETFKLTMDGICRLSPESVTIHTLSMKRSSKLTGDNVQIAKRDCDNVSAMLSCAYDSLENLGLAPYYLYRQSRMLGNMENTGWSKPDFEGIYNVFIMDETHTILACGAGAVTKLKDPYSDRIERIFNFKYPYEYNDRFEELIERKKTIGPFYKELF